MPASRLAAFALRVIRPLTFRPKGGENKKVRGLPGAGAV